MPATLPPSPRSVTPSWLAGALVLIALAAPGLRAAEPEKAVFAAGCFWCVEAIYERVPGVQDAVSGFAGGTTPDPTYESHGDHIEAVEVTFDPDKVSYEQLVRIFFKSHDATDGRGVEPDFGPSYRSALLYRNTAQRATIERVKAEVQKTLPKPIATILRKFERFYPVEEYHQDFVRKNPNHPYVRNVSLPRVKETLGETAPASP